VGEGGHRKEEIKESKKMKKERNDPFVFRVSNGSGDH